MGLLAGTFRIARQAVAGNATTAEVVDEHASPLHGLPDWFLICMALGCLILAACASGMTLGYMSLDTIGLEIVSQGTNQREATAASVILPVREQGNLLLVTLLLTNTVATELLPLVLEALVPGGTFSLVTSVLSLIIFSEIIPQSFCSRNALEIGAYMIGFVKFLRIILYPIAAPVAFLLDLMLGQELGTLYDRDGLKGLMEVYSRNKYGVLTADETAIMKGTLDFTTKTVKDALTKAEDVFMLDVETKLDRSAVLQMLSKGHSRIPLYEGNRNNIVCLLLLKQLVLVDVDDEIPIRALINNKKRAHKVRVAPALYCTPTTPLTDILREFQRGRSHMAIVYEKIPSPQEPQTMLGILTIEDLIEELIGNIVDETDVYISNEGKEPVLVRNGDGKLIRATPTRLPGTNSIILKEIDVEGLKQPLVAQLRGQQLRGDWKKKKRQGAYPQSSGQLPDIGSSSTTARRPRDFVAAPGNPGLGGQPSLDADEFVEDRAGKESEELLQLRSRQYSLPGASDEIQAGEDSDAGSIRWKKWSGIRDNSFGEAGDNSTASLDRHISGEHTSLLGGTASSSLRPNQYMSLDIARFHETISISDDEREAAKSAELSSSKPE